MAINLSAICAANNFTSATVGYNMAEGVSPWNATIHGEGIGAHGCTFGYGETPEEALASCVNAALAHRALKGLSPHSGEVEFL